MSKPYASSFAIKTHEADNRKLLIDQKVTHQMHRHCQHFSSISQLNLPSSVVRCSLYQTRTDIWTTKNRKRAEFDHKYIFRKFWKYWIICLLAYSYLWSFSTSFYRLGLHQLISNLMGILILRYTG